MGIAVRVTKDSKRERRERECERERYTHGWECESSRWGGACYSFLITK